MRLNLTTLIGRAVPALLPFLLVAGYASGKPIAAGRSPVGWLDGVNPVIGGWAHDPDEPAKSIPVHLYFDGIPGSCNAPCFMIGMNADEKRPDVNSHGIAGDHGYTLTIPKQLRDGKRHVVRAYGLDTQDPANHRELLGSPKEFQAKGPVGYLDGADGKRIAGWAKDEDFPDAPVMVEIYVDKTLVKRQLASSQRSDVGKHAFHWQHEPFGSGKHEVSVKALGIDGHGYTDGVDSTLINSPTVFDAGCAGLLQPALEWCDGQYPYWVNRQTETNYLQNDQVRIGVNTAYGGTIFQLYGPEQTDNLIMEHGGAAVGLSLWLYDPQGPSAWFSYGGNCDPLPYRTQCDCDKSRRQSGNAGCVLRAYSTGDHVSDCSEVSICNRWESGACWNPIASMGPKCTWGTPVDSAANITGGLRTVLKSPFNFTKTDAVPGLTYTQDVTLGPAYAKLEYTVDYQGKYAFPTTTQEVPAIFANNGMDEHFYYFDLDKGAVQHVSKAMVERFSRKHYPADEQPGIAVEVPGAAADAMVKDPAHPRYGRLGEGWWTGCDATERRCLTVATFNPLVAAASMSGVYLTPIGFFGVPAGFHETFSVYLFPFKHDREVAGLTVRQWVAKLREATPQRRRGPQVSVARGGGLQGVGDTRTLDRQPLLQRAARLASRQGAARKAAGPVAALLEEEAPLSCRSQGNVDTINPIQGWAIDPEAAPETTVTVEVYFDGGPDACGKSCSMRSFPTSIQRDDVNRVLNITGTHGFALEIPAAYRDHKPHSVRVFALKEGSGEKSELGGSNQTIKLEPLASGKTASRDTQPSVGISSKTAVLRSGKDAGGGAETTLAGVRGGSAGNPAGAGSKNPVAGESGTAGGPSRRPAKGTVASGSATIARAGRAAARATTRAGAREADDGKGGGSLDRCSAAAKLPQGLYGEGIVRASQLRNFAKSLELEYQPIGVIIAEKVPDFEALRPSCLSEGAHLAYAMNALLPGLSARCGEAGWNEPGLAFTWEGLVEVGRVLERCGPSVVQGVCPDCP